MNLAWILVKNRLPVIKKITLEAILYFFLIIFIHKIFDIQIIINIVSWLFLSYLLGRYSLIYVNTKCLIYYFAKLSLIYLIVKFFNYMYDLNNHGFDAYFLIVILFNIFYFLFFLKENITESKWLTNDIRLIKLYNSSKLIFKRNRISFYDNSDKYNFHEYKGIIVNKKNTDINQLKTVLNKSKKLRLYSSLEWCELFLELSPLDLIDDNDFYKKLKNYKTNFIFHTFKRGFEFICSLVIFILFMPIIILFSILIFFQDGYPPFYSQKRTGLNNKVIKIFKIRSMQINSEKNGPQWSTNNDPRVTLIGKLIRKKRIDELPQLLSVVKGDLSLIGPRPERPEIDQTLESEIISYSKRYIVRPGITGWAQVNYPYGASIEDAKIKQSYDLYYVKNVSFILDLIIFLKTMKLVLNGKFSNPLI